MKRILIIVGGPKSKIEAFGLAAKQAGVDVTLASFNELSYSSDEQPYVLRVAGEDVAHFDGIYVRMIGRRVEDATLLVNYATDKQIPLIDSHYTKNAGLPLSLSKAFETTKLIQAGIPLPRTIFGSLSYLREHAEHELGFPYVLKSTTGKKAREVWSPKDHEEESSLYEKLYGDEKKGKRFFAQAFTAASQRMRIFVLGEAVLGGITRPTRWRRRFIEKVHGEYPEGEKAQLATIPEAVAELAVKAASAVSIDIAGVDIAQIDETGEYVVWEVNSAPVWRAFAKDTQINVEVEILKYLSSLTA